MLNITKTRLSCAGLIVLFFLQGPANASGGLTKATTIMNQFKEEIVHMVPIVAVIALLLLAVGYAAKFTERDTFVRWSIGVIIAGSAAEITQFFFN